jgi:hypothetical protein
VFAGRLDLSPIYATGAGGELDPTFMAAYWPMKTGQLWAPDRLLAAMKLVRLDELKEAAATLVSGASTHIVHGR